MGCKLIYLERCNPNEVGPSDRLEWFTFVLDSLCTYACKSYSTITKKDSWHIWKSSEILSISGNLCRL